MQRLIEVAEKEGLAIEEQVPLPKGFYGLYYQEDGFQPVASLSREIYGRRKLERIVLAEEIGHYLTTSGNCLPRFFRDHSHRLSISRQEYKAQRKGGEILIRTDELLDAFTQGHDELWELAEYFNVPTEYMAFRFSTFRISGR